MPRDPRTGRAWMQLVADCKRYYPWICHLCGQAIPRDLPPGHDLRFEADHVITVEANRRLARNIHNLRPSHHQCNNYRSNRPLTPALIQEITAKFARPRRPALAFFDVTPAEEGGRVDDLTSAAPEGDPAGDFSP